MANYVTVTSDKSKTVAGRIQRQHRRPLKEIKKRGLTYVRLL